MKVVVDHDRCVASGQRVMAADEVFDQLEEDGIVVLRDAEPPAELADEAWNAASVCPALAITVVE